jgi:hypothetical protein
MKKKDAKQKKDRMEFWVNQVRSLIELNNASAAAQNSCLRNTVACINYHPYHKIVRVLFPKMNFNT